MQFLSDLLFSGEDLLQASAAPVANGLGPRAGDGISLQLQQESRAFASAFDAVSRVEISADPLTFDAPAPPAPATEAPATAAPAPVVPAAAAYSPSRFAHDLSAAPEEISPVTEYGVEPRKANSLNDQGYAVVELPAATAPAPAGNEQRREREMTNAVEREPGQLRVTSGPANQSDSGQVPAAADETAADTTPPVLDRQTPARHEATPDEIAPKATAGVTVATEGAAATEITRDTWATGVTGAPDNLRRSDRADEPTPFASVAGWTEGKARDINSIPARPAPAGGATAPQAMAALPETPMPPESSALGNTSRPGNSPAPNVPPAAGPAAERPALSVLQQSAAPGELRASADAVVPQAASTAAAISLTETAGQTLAARQAGEQVAVPTQTNPASPVAPQDTITEQVAPHSAKPQSHAPKLPNIPFAITVVTRAAVPANAAQAMPAVPAGLAIETGLSVPVASAVLTPSANAAVATAPVDPAPAPAAQTLDPAVRTPPIAADVRTAQAQPQTIQGTAHQPAQEGMVAAPATQTPAAPAAAQATPGNPAPVPPAHPAGGPAAPQTDTAFTAIDFSEGPIKTVQQSIPGQAEAQQALLTPGSSASATAPASGVTRMIADPAIQSQALQQLATAIEASHKGSGRMELRLDPPELGRVSIDFRFDGDHRVTAILHADQPETASLMRRSLDILMRDLASAGFTDINLSMGSGGREAAQQQAGQQQAERPSHAGGQYASARDSETQAQKAPKGYRPAWSADTIDIRL
ncbi:flagellar hook-length control protein FliK [Aquisalinus flavus]|uniref:Flagellar hook-length control protein-like C-terminal domain-containing protein n=1 Tax=Aquisalinus flavus TaxID=1526572 RepID=A0A8J2Y5E4_9PROT|nr:flagellar hook-length control protein FliK [Aquisalinus flavus]MBD0425909.1 flagellar hook-length control protein FliK [Aquisalinus flavus]UNE48497.1 hypothetical protein FF099_10770 [Aquisalinus flavus]GGD12315.1 hypothetical protein GCM10011342_21350 [Aquisalinus flavus]